MKVSLWDVVCENLFFFIPGRDFGSKETSDKVSDLDIEHLSNSKGPGILVPPPLTTFKALSTTYPHIQDRLSTKPEIF